MTTKARKIAKLQKKIDRILNQRKHGGEKDRPRVWNKNKYKAFVCLEQAKCLGGGKGHIYLCHAGDDVYKIGKTTNLERRFKELSAANPQARIVWSTVVGNATSVESTLHSMFKEKRVSRELYRLDREDRDKLRAYLAEAEVGS